jgi:hypothetical protein
LGRNEVKAHDKWQNGQLDSLEDYHLACLLFPNEQSDLLKQDFPVTSHTQIFIFYSQGTNCKENTVNLTTEVTKNSKPLLTESKPLTRTNKNAALLSKTTFTCINQKVYLPGGLRTALLYSQCGTPSAIPFAGCVFHVLLWPM